MGRIFSFAVQGLPALPIQKTVNKMLSFSHQRKDYRLEVELNETYIKLFNSSKDFKQLF
jgi:hypothetical protein